MKLEIRTMQTDESIHVGDADEAVEKAAKAALDEARFSGEGITEVADEKGVLFRVMVVKLKRETAPIKRDRNSYTQQVDEFDDYIISKLPFRPGGNNE